MKSSPNKALSKLVISFSVGMISLVGLAILHPAQLSKQTGSAVLGASTRQRTVTVSGKNYSCTATNCAQNKTSYDCRSTFDFKGKGICYWNLSKSACTASQIYKTPITPYGNLNIQIRKLNKLNDLKTPELVWYNCRIK